MRKYRESVPPSVACHFFDPTLNLNELAEMSNDTSLCGQMPGFSRSIACRYSFIPSASTLLASSKSVAHNERLWHGKRHPDFHEPQSRRGCPLAAQQRKTFGRTEFFAL